MVDVADSKSADGDIVWVRVPPPAPRQKNSAPFRFRGLRKSRENCTSAASFFLSETEVSQGTSVSVMENGSDLNCPGAPKGEIRTGFPLFWCRAFGAGLSAALKRERGFPSPLALSPCRLGSWFGFGFPRCATSKQHHEVTSRRRRRPVDRWCCFSFPNRKSHGDFRFGF